MSMSVAWMRMRRVVAVRWCGGTVDGGAWVYGVLSVMTRSLMMDLVDTRSVVGMGRLQSLLALGDLLRTSGAM